jgi:hypothetical protein
LSFWQQQRVPGKVPDPVNGGDYLLEGQELEMGLLQDGATELQLTVQPARVVGPAANQSNDDIEMKLHWNDSNICHKLPFEFRESEMLWR